MIEALVRMKLVFNGFVQDILASSAQTVMAASVIFIISIAGFAMTYLFLYRFHQVSLVRYKGKTIMGAVVPLPAFQVSEALRNRVEVRVKNDLKLRAFAGSSTNVAWQSFSQDESLGRQFPKEGPRWLEFRDMIVLGLSPTQMIEQNFRKYGLLKFKITFYRDNMFDTIFPIQVLQEYFSITSVEDLQRKIQAGQLSDPEACLFQALSAAAPQIRREVFETRGEGQLLWLRERLIALVSEIEKKVEDRARLRDIFYGEVLKTMAPPGMQMEFQFDSLPLQPEVMDFLYTSTLLATSNVPSELVPVTNDVRVAMWLQLMFSYFNLALLVAALVKWLKIA
jgi:hypothetical protein